jgi:hypothetical protein
MTTTTAVSPEEELFHLCELLIKTGQAKAAVQVLWDWLVKQDQAETQARALAAMAPGKAAAKRTAVPGGWKMIEGGKVSDAT